MKKRIEQEELLADVLTEDEECRASTLEHGLVALRRVRSRRRVSRLAISVVLPVMMLATALVVRNRPEAPAQVTQQFDAPPAPAVKTIAGTPIRVLSDEELLDLFKGHPVALAGKPGHQRLLFLDEEKN